MIEQQVGFVLAAVAVVVVGSLVARRFAVPVPVVLVLAGLGYAMLPGPNVELDPDVVLVVVIPPLLYAAAIEASLIDIRGAGRPVASLSVGLVLATAFVVGGLLARDGAGAAVRGRAGAGGGGGAAGPGGRARGGPPGRAAAAAAHPGRGRGAAQRRDRADDVPGRGGRGDRPGFSMVRASGQFALAALGGVATGLAVAWLARQLYRRLDDPLLETAMSLATPFAAYLLADRVHASRVLRGRRRRAVDQPLLADGHLGGHPAAAAQRLAAGRAAAGGSGVPAHRAAGAGRARRAGRHRPDPHGAGLRAHPGRGAAGAAGLALPDGAPAPGCARADHRAASAAGSWSR